MTEAQILRARQNLARLVQRVDDYENPAALDTDAPWPPDRADAPHRVWMAYHKIPLIRARLRAAGVTP